MSPNPKNITIHLVNLQFALSWTYFLILISLLFSVLLSLCSAFLSLLFILVIIPTSPNNKNSENKIIKRWKLVLQRNSLNAG